jgi:hypothetical protein
VNRTLGVVRSTYLGLPDGVALWHEGRSFLLSRHEELRGALEVPGKSPPSPGEWCNGERGVH